MRDNARRLLTILTVIPPCGWCWASGRCPSATVIFSLCILLAGGAALWRQRRRAVSRQRSEIVLPPEDFQGQWFWSAGIPTVCFPGVRRTAKPVTAGISGVTARSSCRGWRSTGGGASGAGIAGFRAAGGGTGAPPLRGASGAVAARLAAEYRSVPNLAKRSAAGVERVLGDAAAAVPRKAAGLPSRRRGLVSVRSRRDKRPVRLPGGSGRAALPHACIRRCGWRAF